MSLLKFQVSFEKDDLTNDEAIQILLDTIKHLGENAKVRMSIDEDGQSFWDEDDDAYPIA